MRTDFVKHLCRCAFLTAMAVLITTEGLAQTGSFDPFKATSSKTDSPMDVISSVEFVDTPVTTLFKMISDLTGWSIMMSPEVSRQPPRINIWIKNMTPEEVLDRVVEVAGLVTDRKGASVTVMTFEEYCRLHGVEKHVFQLKHAPATAIATIMKSYVKKDAQSQVMSDENGNRIILLVPKPLADSLEQLILALDVPFELEGETIKIVALKYLEASVIVPRLEQFLADEMRRSQGIASGSGTTSSTGVARRSAKHTGGGDFVRFMIESKLNVIVLRGFAEHVERAEKLITDLDIQRDTKVVGYMLQYTDARDVYTTLNEIVGQDHDGYKGRLRLALSEQNSSIVVEGSSRDHQRIARIIKTIDKPLPPGTGGIRLYRLENSMASEVAVVLQALVEEGDQPRAKQEQRGVLSEAMGGIRRVQKTQGPGGTPSHNTKMSNTSTGGPVEYALGEELPPRIIAAPEINAIIIKASSAQHEELAGVVRELDRPRDQVLLEVTIVAVRSDKGFRLGVELAGAGVNGSGVDQIGFTHYGIGQVDTSSGAIRFPIDPLLGLNYAIFNAADFSVVLNALETVGTVRITSSPTLVVQDNETAEIRLINQEPFEVTEQGQSTSLTSFGGYVDAGTILSVTPHMTSGDWIRLTYELVFSSFGARDNPILPPSRRESYAQGTVRLPAEHVVLIGGLVSSREERVLDSVPFLSKIPLLGELFKSRLNDDVKETIFMFVRPVLLRDPFFEDLKLVSTKYGLDAKLSAENGPVNKPKMLNSLGGTIEQTE